jgi:hypothetical protein
MVALVIENDDQRGTSHPLARGPNLVGRAADCAVRLVCPSVSGQHCEVLVSEFEVRVRDLGSSNGTAVDGVPVTAGEVVLRDGQILALGDLRLRVVIPPVHIAIPELSGPGPAGPACLADGQPACETHRTIPATHVCSRCTRTFCTDCVKRIRVMGGATRLLCPACSHPCGLVADADAGAGESWRDRVAQAFRQAFDFRRQPRRSPPRRR